jgi:phosphatidylglycerophosphatase A
MTEVNTHHWTIPVVTWFYVGKSPYAPGTLGSLAALPFAWVIHDHFHALGLLAASFALFVLGWIASRIYLRVMNKEGDPQEIVIDEVAAQWLLCAFFPLSIQSYAIAFLLFRLFDITKPWPISVVDRRVKGGLGVMADDMLASIVIMILILLIALGLMIAGRLFWVLNAMGWLGADHVF